MLTVDLFVHLQFKYFEFGIGKQKDFSATATESAIGWPTAIPIESKSITDEFIVVVVVVVTTTIIV